MSSRNARYEQRKREQGLVKITLWVPVDRESDIKEAVSLMCSNPDVTVGNLRSVVTGRAVSMRNLS